MKLKIGLFLSMVMLTGALQAAEMFYIVKLTDMIGGVGYKVMSADEYKTAFQEVQDEMKIFNAVMAECKKEWSADTKKEEPFPSSKIKARKISKSGSTYPSMEKAAVKLERLEEGATEAMLEELDKHSKSFKNMDDRTRAKETAKLNAFKEGFEMVSKKMGEKLGRQIPDFGFSLIAPEPKAKH